MNIDVLWNGDFFAIVDLDNKNDDGDVYLITNGNMDFDRVAEGEAVDVLEIYKDWIDDYARGQKPGAG